MGTYSARNIRAPKGECRETGRDYDGRFQKGRSKSVLPYDPVADLASMQARHEQLIEQLGQYLLENNQSGVLYCETQIGFVRAAMDTATARMEGGAGEDPNICASCGKPGRDGICDNCVFAEDIREGAPSPFGRNGMTDDGVDPSYRTEDTDEEEAERADREQRMEQQAEEEDGEMDGEPPYFPEGVDSPEAMGHRERQETEAFRRQYGDEEDEVQE